MENTLEAMTKEELLARRQQDEMRMSELDRNKRGSSVPGIWHSTPAFKILKRIPKSQSGSRSNQFATKEQVTRTAQSRQALVIYFPSSGSPIFDMDRWFIIRVPVSALTATIAPQSFRPVSATLAINHFPSVRTRLNKSVPQWSILPSTRKSNGAHTIARSLSMRTRGS